MYEASADQTPDPPDWVSLIVHSGGVLIRQWKILPKLLYDDDAAGDNNDENGDNNIDIM